MQVHLTCAQLPHPVLGSGPVQVYLTCACSFPPGCMAERLKEEILDKEKMVDILAGPDAYRDLPRLLAVTESGQQAANVLLSFDETYADVMPVQASPGATSAFV